MIGTCGFTRVRGAKEGYPILNLVEVQGWWGLGFLVESFYKGLLRSFGRQVPFGALHLQVPEGGLLTRINGSGRSHELV